MAEGVGGNMHHFGFKILVVGDKGSGKTAIVKRYTSEVFQDHEPSTLVDHYVKRLQKFNRIIDLTIYVIPGGMSIPFVVAKYPDVFKNVHGVSIVFDPSKEDKFRTILEWSGVVNEVLSNPTYLEPIPTILISNKCDLYTMDEICEQLLRSTFCPNNDILEMFTTSAKENINITEAIDFILQEMIKRAARFRKETFLQR